MSETSIPSIQIRIARLKDHEIVVDMFLKLLQFVDQFENDMLPVRENAVYITDNFFMPAAEKGEPILIAWDGDRPVGAIFWRVHETPFKARWTFAYGYGTYVEEAYRSRKVGTLLRQEAIRILKAKGIQKLMTMVHFKNEVSIKASDRMGFVPFARVELTDVDELAGKL